ncbi:MAG: SCO6745 family protein [Actinomycetota bacterium]
MEPSVARRMWRLLEPYHAVIYFAPEARERYEAAGLRGGWMGYFASRGAALGPVSAGVIIATFYNFHPNIVRRAIPDAWRYSSPEKVLAARYDAADAALRRLLGEEVGADAIQQASALAKASALACTPEGRPLFAAHAVLDWPTEPHLVLWHAATLLREFRGDGHVAALVSHQIDGCEAHVLVAAAGVVPAEMLREFRWWSEEEWDAAAGRLQGRGLLDGAGALTPEGKELRRAIEYLTDVLALPPFAALGDEDCRKLEDLMEPMVARIHASSGVLYPNPIGLPIPA